MYFELLQLRLVAHIQQRVQRGELTERGLARHTGISQPHLHNVLKGVRVLSPRMADLLLHHLHITLLDLLDADELAAQQRTGQAG
jgi:transcriptional regulator with XRE-family HTH domain